MRGCMLQYKNSTIQRRTEDGNEDEGGRAGMGLRPTHNGAPTVHTEFGKF